MSNHPHCQAAHINAICEEGSREEMEDWLQKQWNEICALRTALTEIKDLIPHAHPDYTNKVWQTAKNALGETELKRPG